MLFARARMPAFLCASTVAVAYLTGCASPPPEAPKPPQIAQPAPQSSVEKFQVVLDAGITLDYQVEKKVSKVNSKSCFAFISGTLSNVSDKTLSKKSVLDFAVIGQGKQLYRDITNPLADIPSGFNSVFEMVVSPVFANGCPTFDRINIALRKVVL
jgi:hypothetical protein